MFAEPNYGQEEGTTIDCRMVLELQNPGEQHMLYGLPAHVSQTLSKHRTGDKLPRGKLFDRYRHLERRKRPGYKAQEILNSLRTAAATKAYLDACRQRKLPVCEAD